MTFRPTEIPVLAPEPAVIPEPTVEEKAKKILEDARKLITPYESWGRFHFHAGDSFCALGAIEAADDGREWSPGQSLAINKLAATIDPRTRLRRERAVYDFNDNVPLFRSARRHHKKVLAKFDQAIKNLSS